MDEYWVGVEEFAEWLVKYKVIPSGAMAGLVRDFKGEKNGEE